MSSSIYDREEMQNLAEMQVRHGTREELWQAVFPQNLACGSRVLSLSLCGLTSLNQGFPGALGLMCLCSNRHSFA